MQRNRHGSAPFLSRLPWRRKGLRGDEGKLRVFAGGRGLVEAMRDLADVRGCRQIKLMNVHSPKAGTPEAVGQKLAVIGEREQNGRGASR